jgi:aminoglycoside phosphotransferase (APT) family kinase protein
VSDDLAAALADVLGADHIADLTRLSGGASRETFRFTADGRALVLQRQRGGDTRNMGIEADVVRAAAAAGVPVPKLVASSADRSALGAGFMVLTAVEGETIARKILRDEEFRTARSLLPMQLGTALAQVHLADVSSVVGLTNDDQLAQYRLILDATQQPHPAFELAFRWLEANRPDPVPPTLVHGDFRLGNIMVGPDGLRAVLDWELAHIGDPMEDLGWLCVKAWRFGSPKPVAGLGEYDELIVAYEVASGQTVDPDVVRWWEVLGTLKWGIMCIGQASTHTSGVARSHELAAIGRRVCENEHDLFLALEGRW